MAWNWHGYEIDTNHGGEFVTKKDDFEFTAKTLDEVKAAIEKEVKSLTKKPVTLKVIGVLQKDGWKCDGKLVGSIHKAVITGINRTSRALTMSGMPDFYVLHDVVADTPTNRQLLERMLEAKKVYELASQAVDEKEVKKADGYGRIDSNRYGEFVATLEKQYAESVKE